MSAASALRGLIVVIRNHNHASQMDSQEVCGGACCRMLNIMSILSVQRAGIRHQYYKNKAESGLLLLAGLTGSNLDSDLGLSSRV